MPIVSFARHIAEAARRFVGAKDGNVAMIFTVALLPLLAFIGAAIDYGRASKARASLQGALDSAALMVSRDFAQGTISSADLTSAAQKYVSGLFTDKTETALGTINVTYTAPNSDSGATIQITSSGTINTVFMKIVGFPNMNFGASSTTTWGQAKLRVAMALDNTGSMKDDGKMAALQNAVAGSGGLIDQLSALAKSPDDVYVSIVPFAKVVNVDASNNGKDWIDWTDWLNPPTIQPNNGIYQAQIPNSKFSAAQWSVVGPGSPCPFTSANGFPTINGSPTFACMPTSTNDSNSDNAVTTIPTNGKICPGLDAASHTFYNGCWDSVATGNKTTFCTGSSCSCSNFPSSSNCSCTGKNSGKSCSANAYTHTWQANSTSGTWTGCVTDRDQSKNMDEAGDPPTTSDPTTLFPANQYDENGKAYCDVNSSPRLKPIIPLSSSWSSLKNAINTMQPTGGTNQAIGLAWAWQSLQSGGPLPVPAEQPGYVYNHAIILLSDGLNTEDRWPENGNGKTQNGTKIDDRQAKLCANIKAARDPKTNALIYTVYVIQLNTGSPSDPESQVLKGCASSVDKFYQLKSSTEVVKAFNAIGTDLAKLRVAR
jgi:Flp pilus assembly protein TadG